MKYRAFFYIGTTIVLLTVSSFQINSRSSVNTKIPGQYYRTFSPGRDGWTEYNLTIKKNSNYSEKFINHGRFSGKGITKGTCQFKGDTVILNPVKSYSKYKSKKGVKKLNCDCRKQNNSSTTSCDIDECEPDTLIYKNDTLWHFNSLTKEISESYTRNKEYKTRLVPQVGQ